MSSTLKHYPILINGDLITTEQQIKVVNPSTEEIFSTCSKASAHNLDEAVKAAKKAQKKWEKSDLQTRQSLLNKIADVLSENSEELS